LQRRQEILMLILILTEPLTCILGKIAMDASLGQKGVTLSFQNGMRHDLSLLLNELT
jgi:hypothetical protein